MIIDSPALRFDNITEAFVDSHDNEWLCWGRTAYFWNIKKTDTLWVIGTTKNPYLPTDAILELPNYSPAPYRPGSLWGDTFTQNWRTSGTTVAPRYPAYAKWLESFQSPRIWIWIERRPA